jgi:hypothetical protein
VLPEETAGLAVEVLDLVKRYPKSPVNAVDGVSLAASAGEVFGGSRPVVGSSRKSTRGACMSARAIITRCDCPPEKKSGLSPARSRSPNWSSSSSARSSRSRVGLQGFYRRAID